MPLAGRIPRIEVPYGANAAEPQSAFTRGPNLRPLRLVIDRTTVRDDEAAEVLLGFAHHADVEIISTDPADGGWWIEIGEHDQKADIAPVTVHKGGKARAQCAVWSLRNMQEVAAGFPGPTEDVLSAFLLARASRSAHADALATLVNPPKNWIHRENVLTPEEAIALMGLNLRLRGDFTYEQGGNFERGEEHSDAFDRGLFYWVLTRTMLPAAWRWFSACVQTSVATGDDKLIGLGGSALLRFDRVLRARDRVHEQFQVPQDNNTADEAHFYLDVVLLQLVGVFDAVARVAHDVYGVPGNERRVSWRREDKRSWRTALALRAPQLASLMNQKRAARDTLELAAILRNTIHGEALQSIAVRRGARTDYTVFVPSADVANFVAAARRRGGLKRWGLRDFGNQQFLIAADRFIEALIPDAARALNRLMSATDVALLPGATVGSRSRPPQDPRGPFATPVRQRLRLLAGL